MANGTTINSGYEDSIFISYAHIDNTRFVAGHKGWVDALHEYLSLRLYQLLGEKPQMWRDPLLAGNESIEFTLRLKVSEGTILVVILSPRYVKSEECLKELHQFCRPGIKADRSRTDTKARVFKLIKTPIDDSEHPEELQGLLGYQFYETDPITGRPREYQHVLGFDSFPKFIERVDDVAWDIKELIRQSSAQSMANGQGI